MARLTADRHESEAANLPPVLPVGSRFGLGDRDLSALKGPSLVTKLQVSARKDVRKATGRLGAIPYFQQMSVSWPSTTPMMIRLASFAHPSLIDPAGKQSTYLAGVMSSIKMKCSPPKEMGAVITEYAPSSLESLENFTRTLVEAASGIASLEVIRCDPPGARPKLGEEIQSWQWSWWKVDLQVWAAKQAFGVRSYLSPTPSLPTDADKPIVVLSGAALANLHSLADRWGLKAWQRDHLVPRLLSETDLAILCDADAPTSGVSGGVEDLI